MVKRYYGGVISATQVVVNTSSATGFFNITQQMQAAQAGTWPPPGLPENTAGWFGGGYAPGIASTVQRITFVTDTATSTTRGPLSLARPNLAATGNTTDGWFGGGTNDIGNQSTVQRITYATDTATASVRGPLSSARYKLAAAAGMQL